MKDKKLTDAEIVKGLECCGSGDDGCEKGCPLQGECISPVKESEKIMQNALDLINRLQAESETVRKYIHDNGLEWDLLSYCKRNEKLKGIKTNDWLVKGISKEQLKQEKIQAWKAEAYKEFAERLKEKYKEHYRYDDFRVRCLGVQTDNLLKELVGDN